MDCSTSACGRSERACLWVITEQFPFGIAENFLAAELPYLAQVFDSIHLLPTGRDVAAMGPPRTLPPRVVLRRDVVDNLARRRARQSLQHAACLGQLLCANPALARAVGIDVWTLLRQAGGSMATNLRRLGAFLVHASLVAAVLEESSHLSKPTAVYGYWLNAGALGACLAFPHLPAVARAHGHDLYGHRHPGTYLPLQAALVRRLRAMVCISAHGAAYAHSQFAKQVRAIELCPLGVAAAPHRARPSTDATLRVVSCAHISPIKGLDRWVAALAQVSHPLHWTHLGNGPHQAALQRACAALPSHISVTWRGAVAGDAVLPALTAEPVDLFVNTSYHEGRPVSIMEALSVGLPVRAPRVGGIPELLPAAWLWPEAASPQNMAATLGEFAASPVATRCQQGEQAWHLWHTRANAAVAYPAFVAKLQQALARA